MMSPLVYVALRAVAHHDDYPAARPAEPDLEETVSHQPRSFSARHLPTLTKPRRLPLLSRHGVPRTHLP